MPSSASESAPSSAYTPPTIHTPMNSQRDGKCVATSPGDASALASALAALAASPARRATLGAAARAQAVRRWDRRLLAARFCAVVEGAARPRAAAPALRASTRRAG